MFILTVLALALASAEVYFKDTFENADGWVKSNWRTDDGTAGDMVLATGDWFGEEGAQGFKTSQDARFYAYSKKFDAPFSNEGKDLVLQFSVKHAQKLDCGGGYIKLFPDTLDQKELTGDSDYFIMFGPDICGTGTKKIHAIFGYKAPGKDSRTNLLIKREVTAETDELTHVYTLIVKPDNTYEIKVDGASKQTGSLFDDWDFLPPKQINDPAESKPSDWVDEAQLDDPDDVKPEGYDDIPKQIADPEAEKPDDWSDEDDGEWEAPLIDNPDYKGEWSPKRIDNPDYKGPWVHPKIDNPEYFSDDTAYKFDNIGHVGFDLWQVKSGSIFDNIFVGDSAEEADAFLAETFTKNKDAEKKMFDDKKQAEADAAEAARKASEEAAQNEDDADDDFEDDEEFADEKTHEEL